MNVYYLLFIIFSLSFLLYFYCHLPAATHKRESISTLIRLNTWRSLPTMQTQTLMAILKALNGSFISNYLLRPTLSLLIRLTSKSFSQEFTLFPPQQQILSLILILVSLLLILLIITLLLILALTLLPLLAAGF